MKMYNRLFVFFICLVSAMGGLLFGYDWVVIGGAKLFYEAFFGIANDSGQQAWAMSSAILGCLLGATTAGMLADRFGRKPLLVIAAAVIYIVREKRKGVKCIGCPAAGCCSGKCNAKQ